VNYVEYVVVRHGTYGFHDSVRKGGSDEGEEKPESRAVMIEYGGLYFLTVSEVKIFCLVTTPRGTMKDQPVRSIWSFFDGTFPIWFGIGISLKLATTRSVLGGLIANYKYTLVVDAKGSITIC
jgi:hypothetical protein